MRAATLGLMLFCLLPTTASAGQVYGTLWNYGKPVGAGIKVEVACGRNTYSAVTDNYGSYRLFARDNGKCTFRVYFQNQTPETTIDSYPDAAHYDFDLVLNGGRYELRRK